jgi:hypothetical protein
MSSLNAHILDNLPPNHLVVAVSETAARYESFDAARAFFARPHHIHLVMPLLQQADVEFGALLEQELYPYGTTHNDAFHSRLLLWQKLSWGIVSIPRRDEPKVQDHSRRHHRYLVRAAYTAKSAQNKSEVFPFRGDNFRLVRMVHGLLAACQ